MGVGVQIIDAEKGTVRNEETLRPLPFLEIPEAIDGTHLFVCMFDTA